MIYLVGAIVLTIYLSVSKVPNAGSYGHDSDLDGLKVGGFICLYGAFFTILGIGLSMFVSYYTIQTHTQEIIPFNQGCLVLSLDDEFYYKSYNIINGDKIESQYISLFRNNVEFKPSESKTSYIVKKYPPDGWISLTLLTSAYNSCTVYYGTDIDKDNLVIKIKDF